MLDGFNSYEGDAKQYIVEHDRGSTIVYATSEAIALARFMAKYPDRSVKRVRRA